MSRGPDLTDREQQILYAVVQSYITTAEPVGSRSVVKRFDLGLSPATVRNVMADLEEKEYLQQLHTSSGRVPTDKGYRYYVNYLMRVQELTVAERGRIEREFTDKLNDADDVLRQTSHLLALITHQAGLAETPNEENVLVRRFELMPLSEERLAVLMADNFGRVRSMTLQLERPIPPEEIPRLNRFLNEQLQGLAVGELAACVEKKLCTFLDEQRGLAEQALEVLNLVPIHRPSQLFLDGATQLFEQPEFKDVDKAREVFGLLEERERLADLLRAAAKDYPALHSRVVIGAEGRRSGLEGISVVASPYRVDGKPVGMIGVLGPRRMPYSRLMAIVNYTAEKVGRILGRLGT